MKLHTRTTALFLLSLLPGLFILPPLSAQEGERPELPSGFGALLLGSTFAEAEEALRSDPNFLYRGSADVSMLRRPNERMIETGGLGYISRAYLQFSGERLYSIVLDIDEQIMDHYALYTAFVGKYGEPDRFGPDESRWENESVIFSLERKGLRVKYLDAKKAEEIRRSGEMEKSFQEMSRDRFLEQF